MSSAQPGNAPVAEVDADSEFATSLNEHIRAGYQIMYVPTSEETRVELEIARVAKTLGREVVTWDCYEAFGGNVPGLQKDEFKNPIKALDQLTSDAIHGDYIFVFRDLDNYMKDFQVERRLRSMAEGHMLVNPNRSRPLIIVSPLLSITPKLKPSISVIEFSLPDENKIKRQIDYIQKSVERRNPDRAHLDAELRELLATNLLGLTSNEAENCLSRCIVKHGGFRPEMVSTIKDEKAAIVKKSEVLTYIPEDSTARREDIGGYDLYMQWLDRRKLSYTPEARAENIDYPKGVVLVGVPGSGKSMMAKATCMVLGLPGYVLDIGSLFGALVGESETRTREVLKQIDAQKGCVLVIDEADKALGDAHTSRGDSGVTRRVFGTILTWLAENKDKTFCIMTLNRTEGLPPELTRAGRFDKIFYTTLPHEAERRQILEIHLRIRGVDPAALNLEEADWKAVMAATESFVGSELEEVVREARYLAFEQHGTGLPTFEQLMLSANSIVPMTKSDAEGMRQIQEFCKDRGSPVTTPREVRVKNQRGTRKVDIN